MDETGVMLGLTRTHARSQKGTRAYSLNPFYRGSKVTVIGAISIKKVVALMTMNDSMDGKETSMVEFNISYDDVKKLASGVLPDWQRT